MAYAGDSLIFLPIVFKSIPATPTPVPPPTVTPTGIVSPPTVPPTVQPTVTAMPTMTPVPTVTPPALCLVGTCFDNPVPLGSSSPVNNFTYRVFYSVLEVERPTSRIDPSFVPPAGMEHVAIHIQAQCNPISLFTKCSVSGLPFKAATATNTFHDLSPGAVAMTDWLSAPALSAGEIYSGWVAMDVPIGASPIQLVYVSSTTTLYFALTV